MLHYIIVGRYYFRVAARDASYNWSEWSDPDDIYNQISDLSEQESVYTYSEYINKVNVLPNPVARGGTVRFLNINTSNNIIKIYTVTGHLVREIKNSDEWNVDTRLSPGIYFAIIYKNGTRLRTVKILIF